MASHHLQDVVINWFDDNIVLRIRIAWCDKNYEHLTINMKHNLEYYLTNHIYLSDGLTIKQGSQINKVIQLQDEIIKD